MNNIKDAQNVGLHYESRKNLLLLVVVYSVLLVQMTYHTGLVFNYYSMFSFEAERILFLVILLPFVLTIYVNNSHAGNLNSILYDFSFLLYYLPGIIVSYILMDHTYSTTIFLIAFCFHSILTFAAEFFIRRLRRIRLAVIKLSINERLTVYYILLLCIISYTLFQFGLPRSFLSLGSAELLYEAREYYFGDLDVTARYLLRWIPDVFIPVIFSASIKMSRIRKKFSLISWISIAYMFLLSQYRGQKAYLVICLIMILILIKPIPIRFVTKYLLYALILVLLFSTVVAFTFFEGSSSFLNTLFFVARRAVIIPSVTTVYWIHWFEGNAKEYWSYVVTNNPTASQIGAVYLKGAHANSGFVADGFSNFGIIGVLMNVMLLQILFVFLGSQFSVRSDDPVSHHFFLILPIVGFIGTRVTTILSTGGFALVVIFSLFVLHRGRPGIEE